eukprot:31551-Pelagococcus_subviridis.AAC.7
MFFISVSNTGGNCRVNRAMSRSPSASTSASRNTTSSGHAISEPGSNPLLSDAFHALMPSAHRVSASTLPAVDGNRRSRGRRSGAMLFSAPAFPDDMSIARFAIAWRFASVSRASPRRFARIPSAFTTSSSDASSASASASPPASAPPNAALELAGSSGSAGASSDGGTARRRDRVRGWRVSDDRRAGDAVARRGTRRARSQTVGRAAAAPPPGWRPIRADDADVDAISREGRVRRREEGRGVVISLKGRDDCAASWP